MKSLLNFLFVFLCTTNLFAQKEAYNWYFGDRTGINFDSGKAVLVDNNKVQMPRQASHVSISNKSGEFLFMSNGNTIWNKNFEVMENGSDLLKDENNSWNTYSFPKPNTPEVYSLLSYIIKRDSIDGKLVKSYLYNYSEIDMSLNSGLGKVILSTSDFNLDKEYVYLNFIKHSNGEDVWIVGREFETKNIFSFLLTKHGLKEIPVTNNVGFEMKSFRKSTFSPNSEIFAESGTDPLSYGFSTIKHTIIYNFNRTTGEISFLTRVGKSPSSNNDPEFSASSRYIYTLSNEKVLRYDLKSNRINDSEEIVYEHKGKDRNDYYLPLVKMNLGPHKKFYFWDSKNWRTGSDGSWHQGNKYPTTLSLSKIDNPENLDVSSVGFEYEAFSLERSIFDYENYSYGIPNFIPSQLTNIIFYKDPCFQQETHFRLDDPVDTINWDFGEPSSGNNNTANGLNVSHTYSKLGTYTVTATTTRNGSQEVFKTKVTISELPELNLDTVELTQCDDDIDGFSFFNLNQVIPEISNNYKKECFSFHHSLEDAENNENPISNTYYYKNKKRSQETIWTRIENKYTCFRTAQVNLIVTTTQVPDSFQKITVTGCEQEDGEIVFDFSQVQKQIENIFPPEQPLEFSYFLNLKDALSQFNKINDPTSYSTKINGETQEIFVRIDSKVGNDCLGLGNLISLKSKGKIPQFDVDAINYLCPSNPNLEISISKPLENYTYVWLDQNDQILGSDTKLTVTKPGIYSVIATSSKDCESSPKQIKVLEIPQATISIDMIQIAGSSFNEYTVSVNATSLESDTFEYSIDNQFSNYQDEPIFEGISNGWHTMYIRDKEKCATSQIEFFIIGVPKFFSPNDDGINDTWNIGHLDPAKFSDITIEIFDRSGLLITKIRPDEEGWNGSFNGNNMVTTDYWFTIIYRNEKGKIIKQEGNFSLLR